MLISKDQKILFIGDSITDCERARPIGESYYGGLGRGYVSEFDALLSATYPWLNQRVINMGISGNKVTDLKSRWQSDVLDLKPDWLSVMIGINDVWRQFDAPQVNHWHVSEELFERTYAEILESTRGAISNLILATPFYIEPLRQDAMREKMDRYGMIVRALATRYNAILVDTQAAFDEFCQTCYPARIALDRVHPNQTGHMILARAFLKAIEFRF